MKTIFGGDVVKYLNKNRPDYKLNKALRELYNNKQTINNSKLKEEVKQTKMKGIDKQINKLWRESTYKDLEDLNERYIDEVGGYHDGGIGWNPNGIWCGECTSSSCKGCINEYIQKNE